LHAGYGHVSGSELPTTTLHVQIKALHEGLAHLLLHPGKAKVHTQTGQAHGRDGAGWLNLPVDVQSAVANAHASSLTSLLPGTISHGTGQPPKPIGFGAGHLAVKGFGVVRKHA